MADPIDFRTKAPVSFISEPVDGGGSGGNDGGMEHRLSEVEKAIVRIDGSLERIDDRFNRIDKTLDRLVDSVSSFKWQVFGALVVFLVTMFAGIIAVQQMTVSTFQAASAQPPAASPQPTVIVVPAQPAPAPAPPTR